MRSCFCVILVIVRCVSVHEDGPLHISNLDGHIRIRLACVCLAGASGCTVVPLRSSWYTGPTREHEGWIQIAGFHCARPSPLFTLLNEGFETELFRAQPDRDRGTSPEVFG